MTHFQRGPAEWNRNASENGRDQGLSAKNWKWLINLEHCVEWACLAFGAFPFPPSLKKPFRRALPCHRTGVVVPVLRDGYPHSIPAGDSCLSSEMVTPTAILQEIPVCPQRLSPLQHFHTTILSVLRDGHPNSILTGGPCLSSETVTQNIIPTLFWLLLLSLFFYSSSFCSIII